MIKVNDEGYLTDFSQWTKEVGEAIAAENNITMTPRHWEVIAYLQNEHKKNVALSIRKIGKSDVLDIKEFYQALSSGSIENIYQNCRHSQTCQLHLTLLLNPKINITMNEYNGEIRKMMIILSKSHLENVYAAFVLANGARMEGIEAEIFFTFFGLEAIHKKNWNTCTLQL